MNRYEKVRLDLESSIRKVQPSKPFSDIIDEYAQKGFRFKHIFAPTGRNGTPKFYDIIFERITDGKQYMYDYLQIEIDHKAKNTDLVEDYWDDVFHYDVKGWRFVTVFAPANMKGGIPKYYELIFEKEIITQFSQQAQQVSHVPQQIIYQGNIPQPPHQQQMLNQYNQIPQPPLPPHQIPYGEQDMSRPSDNRMFEIPTEFPSQDVKPIVQPHTVNTPDIPVINNQEDSVETVSNREKIHDLVFEEEQMDRYEKPKDIKEMMQSNDGVEKVDKDFAKRFFQQINKKESKVPMKAKPTNVGFVDFDEDDFLDDEPNNTVDFED